MSMRVWTTLFAIAGAFAVGFASLRLVHMLQLESYQGNMYRRWIKRAGQKDLYTCILVGIAALFVRIAWILLYYDLSDSILSLLEYGSDAIYIIAMIYLGFSFRKQKEKKKLSFTGRVIRLLVAILILAFFFHASFFIPSKQTSWSEILLINILRYLPGTLLPFFVLLAYWVTLPIETLNKRRYFEDARKRLAAREDLIKIGLTGSFGKTSTKHILGKLLEQKYNTLITPGSFNTPMGVTRVVRERLAPEHEAFVAEMGARYKGDIRELCTLVGPRYGLITSIGKQHLETFGSFEALIETKGELLECLPDDGAAFLNGDIAECRRMYEGCALQNKFLFGIEGEGLYLRAADIGVTTSGSEFRLITAAGESIPCKTKLLGRHNITNITGAAALALYLGVSLEQIAAGIAEVAPIEHRLQLIEGPVTVIDDAFNANPAGTKAALEVLRAFSNSNRVVVTPGMIELGEEEEALNEEFGRDMARSCNRVILVGRQNAEAMKRGLLMSGFDEGAIAEVGSLDEVTAILPQHAPHGSVVLFENDLPDNYL